MRRPISYRNNGYATRRAKPLQLALTMVLLVSLLLLVLSGITHYTMGEPILPEWASNALHRPQPSLPPGVTSDFEVLNPETKQPYAQLPELGTIQMRLAVTNDSALPVTFRFNNGNQAEFILRRVFTYVGTLFALPLEVWRSSYFQRISPRPTTLVLQPGQTKVYTATFNLTALNAREVPPGGYIAVAVFNGQSIQRRTRRGDVPAVNTIRIEKPL